MQNFSLNNHNMKNVLFFINLNIIIIRNNVHVFYNLTMLQAIYIEINIHEYTHIVYLNIFYSIFNSSFKLWN